MKKKVISTIIAAAVLLSYCTAFANPYSALSVKLCDIKDITNAETTDPAPESSENMVSLSLSAGSTTMTLNGEEVEITAPYVTDSGVTLVPVRVITEAFGAEVAWNEEDQSVNIVFKEVNIRLTIGSKAAVINDHAEELESAPELKDGATMVPLRFISETFGSKVEYNSESGLITVTLTDDEEAEMIRGMHENEYIGDSYFGWSMKTPKGLNLSNRSSNGKSLVFSDEYSNQISIDVYESKEEIDVTAEFQEAISSVYGTIIAAEKSTDSNGNPTYTLGIKDSYSHKITKTIVKDKTEYSITVRKYTYSEPTDESTAAFKDLELLMDTFSLTIPDDMYDFTDIKDGVREYENEELKISFNIPKNYSESYDDGINQISFGSDENEMSGITVKIYSKSETASKDTFAREQYEIDKTIFNPEITSIEEPVTITVNGTEAISHTIIFKLDDCEFINKKVFYELGEYIYLLNVSDESEEICQNIIDSFKAEELDYEETGTIISPATLMEGYTYKSGDYSMELPKYWSSDYYYGISDLRTDATILNFDNYFSYSTTTVEEMINELKQTEDLVIVEPLKWHETSEGRYPTMKFKISFEDIPDVYGGITGKIVGGKALIYLYSYSELYNGGIIETEIGEIIDSIQKIKKK